MQFFHFFSFFSQNAIGFLTNIYVSICCLILILLLAYFLQFFFSFVLFKKRSSFNIITFLFMFIETKWICMYKGVCVFVCMCVLIFWKSVNNFFFSIFAVFFFFYFLTNCNSKILNGTGNGNTYVSCLRPLIHPSIHLGPYFHLVCAINESLDLHCQHFAYKNKIRLNVLFQFKNKNQIRVCFVSDGLYEWNEF